jgi:hypothetical protein
MKPIAIQNYNKKLSSDIIYSISAASPNPLLLSDLPKDVILQDKDTSDQYPAQLIDIAKMDVFELGSLATYAANGIPADEFIRNYLENNLTGHTQVAVYVYKKVRSSDQERT